MVFYVKFGKVVSLLQAKGSSKRSLMVCLHLNRSLSDRSMILKRSVLLPAYTYEANGKIDFGFIRESE